MIYLLTPFIGFMSEMRDMLPIWMDDYRVDDSLFTKEFGMTATPYDEALKQYVDFYKVHQEAKKK
jgi:hypothetical protein